MTEQEMIEELNKAAELDTECAHIEMDKILCAQLCNLGYEKVIEVYNARSKWYA